MKFRDYQEEIIAQGKSILSSKRNAVPSYGGAHR